MRLSVLVLNYKLICQILFLCSINFNDTFGCVSRQIIQDEPRKTKNILELQKFKTTLETIAKNVEGNEPNVISDFQTFLANKYYWQIPINDLHSLWNKLQEFSLQNGFLRSPWYYRRPKKNFKYPISNITIMSIEKIETYLANEDKKFKLTRISSVYRSNPHQETERQKYQAALSGRIFKEQACSIRTEPFCVIKYFREKEIYNIFQIVPKAILLKRCLNECSCIQPNDECLPKSLNNRTEYIHSQTKNNMENTSALYLVDHVSCKCRDRCNKRRCISHFEKIQTSRKSCSCQCEKGQEKICQKILKGYRTISEEDYYCILSGNCIIPECKAGNLSEENLYLRKCPVVSY